MNFPSKSKNSSSNRSRKTLKKSKKRIVHSKNSIKKKQVINVRREENGGKNGENGVRYSSPIIFRQRNSSVKNNKPSYEFLRPSSSNRDALRYIKKTKPFRSPFEIRLNEKEKQTNGLKKNCGMPDYSEINLLLMRPTTNSSPVELTYPKDYKLTNPSIYSAAIGKEISNSEKSRKLKSRKIERSVRRKKLKKGEIGECLVYLFSGNANKTPPFSAADAQIEEIEEVSSEGNINTFHENEIYQDSLPTIGKRVVLNNLFSTKIPPSSNTSDTQIDEVASEAKKIFFFYVDKSYENKLPIETIETRKEEKKSEIETDVKMSVKNEHSEPPKLQSRKIKRNARRKNLKSCEMGKRLGTLISTKIPPSNTSDTQIEETEEVCCEDVSSKVNTFHEDRSYHDNRPTVKTIENRKEEKQSEIRSHVINKDSPSKILQKLPQKEQHQQKRKNGFSKIFRERLVLRGSRKINNIMKDENIIRIEVTTNDDDINLFKKNEKHKVENYEEIMKEIEIINELLKNENLTPEERSNLLLSRGIGFLGLKEYSKAISDFSRAIEIEEDFAEAYCNRGIAFNLIKKQDEAVNDFSKAIELNPKYYEAFNSRGIVYADLQKFSRTIEDCSEAININAEYFEAYGNRGFAYYFAGEFLNAIFDFTRGIEIRDDQFFYGGRADAYLELNMFSKAIHDYSKCIELNPDESELYFQRGNVYSEMNMFHEAINDFSKFIELNPEDSRGYYNRAILFAECEEYLKLIEDCSKIIGMKHEYSLVHFNRGIAYFCCKEFEKAINDFRRDIERNPKHVESYCNLGNCFYELKKYSNAIKQYSKAIALKKNLSDVLCDWGTVFDDIGEFKRAITDFLKAIEINPNESRFYFCISLSYFNLGNFSESLKSIFYIINNLKPQIFHYFQVCKIYFTQKEYNKCEELFGLMLKKFPKYEKYIYMIRLQERLFMSKELLFPMTLLYDILSKDFYFKEKKGEYSKLFDLKMESKKKKQIEIANLLFRKEYENVGNIEREELNFLSSRMRKVKFENINFLRLSDVSLDYNGFSYSSKIKGIYGQFNIKLYHPNTSQISKKQKINLLEKMIRNEHFEIPCHPNIAMIVQSKDDDDENKKFSIRKIRCSKLPGWKNFSKFRNISNFHSPLIITKKYSKKLETYLQERKIWDLQFSNIEFCSIMRGLLMGSQYLHNHNIVHRDLCFQNIFVSPQYGRVWIGGYGCCLNLDENKNSNSFVVHRKNSLMTSFEEYRNQFFQKRGRFLLAPEIRDFDDHKEEFLNYSKSDIYSIGIIAFKLVDYFTTEESNSFPDSFNIERIKEHCDSLVFDFIRGLTHEDYIQRIDYSEALYRMEKILKGVFINKQRRRRRSISVTENVGLAGLKKQKREIEEKETKEKGKK